MPVAAYSTMHTRKHLRFMQAKKELKRRKEEAKKKGWLVYKTKKLPGL